MDEPHKTARTRFDESTAHFRKAHREGIAGLDRRDLDAVDAAIADEQRLRELHQE
jgi:hypothetical protein